MSVIKDPMPAPRASTAPAVTFEVERFERAGGDRLELVGRWYGVRGRRFIRPTLGVEVDGHQRRLLALLEDKPWAAVDGERWQAAFAWDGDPVEATVELAIGPDLAVELSPPSGTGDVRKRAGAAPVERREAHQPRTEAIERAALERELKAARADAERRGAALERVRSTPSAEAEGLRTRLTVVEQANRQLEDDLEAARGELAAARSAAEAERRSFGSERDALIEARDEAQAAADALRGERDAAQRERDSAVRDRDAARIEREAAVSDRDSALSEAESAARDRDGARVERDAARARIDQAGSDRDAARVERDRAVKARGAAAVARETLQRERDAMEAERDAALVERDAVTAARDSALEERDAARGERGAAVTAAAPVSTAPAGAPAAGPDRAEASELDAVAHDLGEPGPLPLPLASDERSPFLDPDPQDHRAGLAPRAIALAVLAALCLVVLVLVVLAAV